MLKVLDVDGAVRRVKGGWEATGEPWSYDTERYARVAAERRAEQEAMLGYITTTECREQYLRRHLDDDSATPCGRCDNCTGAHRSAEVPDEAVQAARQRLARPGVEIEPRRQWPTGLPDLKGRIRAELSAEPGRALGRLTDIGWGTRLRDLFAAGDGPVPDDVFAAVVEVLKTWGWERRPVAVVAVPSGTRPALVGSLAERLAQVGRLEYLGALGYREGPPAARHNSAQRVTAIRGRSRRRVTSPRGSRRRAGRCCWWTTGWTAGGRWRWPPPRSGTPGRLPCCPWPWPSPADASRARPRGGPAPRHTRASHTPASDARGSGTRAPDTRAPLT
ncbi:hypothetical protein GCM10027612_68370 [Microbispora bryophytorum subsp. camponoti]